MESEQINKRTHSRTEGFITGNDITKSRTVPIKQGIKKAMSKQKRNAYNRS